MKRLLLVLLVVLPCLAVKGVDLSQAFNNFACIKSNGYSFAIVRGYMSYGAVDTVGLQNLKNAKAAGLIGDAYFFPCYLSKIQFVSKLEKTATTQVNEFVGTFGEHFDDASEGLTWEELRAQEYGTVWLDVEFNPSTGCKWSTTDFTANCNFVKQLVSEFKARSKLVGIYSSKYQWETIMGAAGNCAQFTSLPLWYAHYDNSASFSDYSKYSFGGWTTPSIKQYTGDTTLCSVGVDLNYY
ncbi:hypothetical protein pb186bvf_017202 [Paramecium bursaria]